MPACSQCCRTGRARERPSARRWPDSSASLISGPRLVRSSKPGSSFSPGPVIRVTRRRDRAQAAVQLAVQVLAAVAGVHDVAELGIPDRLTEPPGTLTAGVAEVHVRPPASAVIPLSHPAGARCLPCLALSAGVRGGGQPGMSGQARGSTSCRGSENRTLGQLAAEPSTIRAWAAGLLAELSPGYVRTLFANLSGVLSAAVVDGLISRNPCALVKPPRAESARVQPWETGQAAAVRQELPAVPGAGRLRRRAGHAPGRGVRAGSP